MSSAEVKMGGGLGGPFLGRPARAQGPGSGVRSPGSRLRAPGSGSRFFFPFRVRAGSGSRCSSPFVPAAGSGLELVSLFFPRRKMGGKKNQGVIFLLKMVVFFIKIVIFLPPMSVQAWRRKKISIFDENIIFSREKTRIQKKSGLGWRFY